MSLNSHNEVEVNFTKINIFRTFYHDFLTPNVHLWCLETNNGVKEGAVCKERCGVI